MHVGVSRRDTNLDGGREVTETAVVEIPSNARTVPKAQT